MSGVSYAKCHAFVISCTLANKCHGDAREEEEEEEEAWEASGDGGVTAGWVTLLSFHVLSSRLTILRARLHRLFFALLHNLDAFYRSYVDRRPTLPPHIGRRMRYCFILYRSNDLWNLTSLKCDLIILLKKGLRRIDVYWIEKGILKINMRFFYRFVALIWMS